MLSSTTLFVVLLLGILLPPSSSSRILAVFPTVSKSHFDFFRPLLDELSSRGHRLTVISSFPRQPTTRNRTDIDLQHFKKVLLNEVAFDTLPEVPTGFRDSVGFLYGQVADFEHTFSHPDVRKLIDSDENFDLVITELWNSDVFLGFGHRFRAPVVLMSSCTLLPWANSRFSNPDNPSYIPTAFLRKFGHLDFLHRLQNFLQLVAGKFAYDFFFDPVSERIARRAFGDSLPPLATLAKDSALLFVNTHHTLHGARPYTPRVIQVGGLHVRERKPLTKVAYAKWYQQFVLNRISEEMSRKYIGESVSSLEELVEKCSLFLVNSHYSMFSGKPLPPQVVQVGGIHVLQPTPLNQELDRWMNDSVHGVVYFSFGSMLRGATLPADKVAAFLRVFGTLPQRVLWKWEDDTLDNLPANVRIMKWLPQRDVLAHPKVKVFISHGGLLGATEAVVSAVPILGIPMYGDQPNNVAALVERGVAVHIDYNNISVESLMYGLNTLLNDNRYSENAKLLSRQFLDRPQSPLETAVYWTEYVIRHRGAPHLQSAAVHLAWYQYYLLDVVAVCVAALAAVLTALFYLFRSCLTLVLPSKSTKLKTN